MLKCKFNTFGMMKNVIKCYIKLSNNMICFVIDISLSYHL